MFILKKVAALFIVSLLLACLTIAQDRPQNARDYFAEGVELLGESEFEKALASFKQTIKLDPKNAAAHGNIGFIYTLLGRVEDSIFPFREAVRLEPENAKYRANLCRSLSQTNKHLEAVTQCEEAVRLENSAPAMHQALAIALRSANRDRDAFRVLSSALERFQNEVFLLVALAELNFDNGYFDDALSNYQSLARINPNDAFFQTRLAQIYLRLERDSEAVAAALRAIEIKPDHPMAYFYLGLTYFELGLHEDSAKSFQRVSELDPRFADAFYYLSQSLNMLGKSEKAFEMMRRAISLEPANVGYLKAFGSMLVGDSQDQAAIDPLKKAVLLAPADFEAKLSLGIAFIESAKYDDALPILMEADRMKPGNEMLNMILRVARARQNGLYRVDEMVRFARENPKDVNVRVSLIQTLGYARRLDEVEVYVNQLVELNPQDTMVYHSVAVVFSTVGKQERAVDFYRKTLEIEENPGAYLGLANYYNKKGQIDEAIRAYERFFELKKDAPNLMLLYAALLRDNGKRREALVVYKRSLEMIPTNVPALFNAGMLSVLLGDLSGARQYLELLRAVDPLMAKTLQRCVGLKSQN